MEPIKPAENLLSKPLNENSLSKSLNESPLPKTNENILSKPLNENSLEKPLMNENKILTEEQKTSNKMSKKAMKRQKKMEDWERKKLEKKLAKKKKLEERKKAEQENPKPEEKKDIPKVSKFELSLEDYNKMMPLGQRIVIDCNFDDKMSEREFKSLVQQLSYVYCTNKRAKHPSNVCITGIGPNIKHQLEKVNYEKWRIKFSEEDYMKLYPKEDLVYLTADATDIMTTIDPSKVYIIGGLVDRNRYKNITFNRAKDQGIKTAKLPLDQYVDIKNATKVLTVNHVFSILLKYIDTKDWAKAFVDVLPLRKHIEVLGETEKKPDEPETKKEQNLPSK